MVPTFTVLLLVLSQIALGAYFIYEVRMNQRMTATLAEQWKTTSDRWIETSNQWIEIQMQWEIDRKSRNVSDGRLDTLENP